MPEKNSEELLKQLENADSTELDDENLEEVAGGGNGNCNNTGCCAPQQN